MGTSTRNKGQSGHTPLVPSWLEGGGTTIGEDVQSVTVTEPIPPNGDENRFTEPRKDFTRYINGGGRDSSSMRNAISRYVDRSLGGSSRATTRLGTARKSTARLYGVLNTLSRSGSVSEIAHQLSINSLEGLKASEFFVRIAFFICPDGGADDEGMARSAYFDAIADNPDLFEKSTEELTVEECSSILQNFMCKVVMEHVMNDIANKTIILPDDIDEVSRMEGLVEQLIKQSVSDAFTEIQQNSTQITNSKAKEITDSIYQRTYEILEGQDD